MRRVPTVLAKIYTENNIRTGYTARCR